MASQSLSRPSHTSGEGIWFCVHTGAPATHCVNVPAEHTPGSPLTQGPITFAPHEPQFCALVCTSTSQPSALELLQSSNDPTHTSPHAPPEHTAAAFAAPGHAFPHIPQFCGSNAVFVHVLPHFVVPAPHWPEQTPPAHTCP
jgi:hypothetical protein